MLSGHCIYKNWHVYTQKIKVLFIVMRALYCKIFYLLKNTIFIIWHLKINTEFKNNKNHSCRNSLKKFHRTLLFIIVWRCSPIIRRSLHQWWHPVFIVFAKHPTHYAHYCRLSRDRVQQKKNEDNCFSRLSGWEVATTRFLT